MAQQADRKHNNLAIEHTAGRTNKIHHQTANSKQQTANSKQQTANSKQQTIFSSAS